MRVNTDSSPAGLLASLARLTLVVGGAGDSALEPASQKGHSMERPWLACEPVAQVLRAWTCSQAAAAVCAFTCTPACWLGAGGAGGGGAGDSVREPANKAGRSGAQGSGLNGQRLRRDLGEMLGRSTCSSTAAAYVLETYLKA